MDIIFQAGQIISNYLAAWVKDKKHIILFKLLSTIFCALSIIAVGRYAASIPILFTIIRSLVCMNKDKFKNNIPIWLCIAGYIIIALLTFNSLESYIDLMPTVTSIIASLILWYGDSVSIKAGLGLGDAIWMVYYFYIGLYVSALNILLQIVVTVISIIRIKLEAKGV